MELTSSSSSSFFTSSSPSPTINSMGESHQKNNRRANVTRSVGENDARCLFPFPCRQTYSVQSSAAKLPNPRVITWQCRLPKTPRNVARCTGLWFRNAQGHANTHSLPLLMYLSSMMPMSAKTNLHTVKPKNSAACRALSSSPTWVGEECFSPGSST